MEFNRKIIGLRSAGRRCSPGRIEVVDDDMAAVLRLKTGAERLKIANDMFVSARRMMASHLAAEHPDWGEAQIQREVSRRISHGWSERREE